MVKIASMNPDVRSRPLKLLFHCPALTDGGAERVWALLAGELAARGHAVHLVVDAEAANGPAVPSGVEPHILPQGRLAALRALRRLLGDLAPDVALSAVAASPLLLTIAASGLDVPLVHAFHGFEEWRTGYLSRLTWRSLPWIARRSARIVAVSDALREYLAESWNVPTEKLVRIWNPVALPDPLPAVDAGDLLSRPREILCIGRLSAEKGHGLLLRAMALMRDREAGLTLVGEGPRRPHLEEQARHLGIADRVRFAGWQDDVWPWLGRARVFALPSRTESFGNVVVEALAAGLPVVCTDTPGPAEILGGDARLGRLVPVTGAEEMAEALDALLENPGDPGPRQMRALDFSAAKGVDAWEGLIRDVAGGRKASGPAVPA